ncbi:MAG TPA: ABC transporter substrate-binding protein [Actinomycetota bacterium]|nr:ABC transporter substrate-binding protein [Actinomycetota bacterium]
MRGTPSRVVLVAALLALGIGLPGGSGQGPALAQTSAYHEAPMLADLVRAGKLAPVDQRLPENPLVVDTIEGIGRYGGVWRRGFLGPSDFNNVHRIVYDALVRYSPDGTKVEPKYASSVTSSKDFTAWTVTLRKGAKWSDGSPFGADDILFWYTDVLLNKDVTPALPVWMKNHDGSPVTVQRVDDITVRWVYKEPNTTFPMELANKDSGDRQYACFLPAHYLRQFHVKYADRSKLDQMVAAGGFKTWVELFAARAHPPENPERPVMAAWRGVTRISDQLYVLRRNPYYVGVDRAGNQLPYIDTIQFKFFANAQSLNLAAIAGQLDEQERHIILGNYPVLKEHEKDGKYRVILWQGFGGADADVTFNETYSKDADLGALFRNRDFRIAMSYAINRNQIKESAFLGLGEARQPVAAPWSPYYPGDAYARKYTEYRPDEANRLLDRIGLDKKDADGFRLFAGGTRRATVEISVVPVFGPWPDVAQLIAKDWERVGIKTIVQVRERSLHFQLRQSNDLQAEIWNEDTAGFPFTGTPKYDPRTILYGNITTGPLWKAWFDTGGREGVEPPAPVKRLVELIDKAKTVAPAEQARIAQEIFKIWVDNVFEIGTIGLTPMDQGVAVVNVRMHNVPAKLGKDWPLRTPGNARTEQFYYQ